MMTSRERVRACLELRTPDRVPLDGTFRPEVSRKLISHFGTEGEEAVLDELGGSRSTVRSLPSGPFSSDQRRRWGKRCEAEYPNWERTVV
jgi:hypothetical protein